MGPVHAVLGYGTLAEEIVDVLREQGITSKILTRSKLDDSSSVQVDALQLDELITATIGVTHLYVTVGLPYKLSVWQKQWPAIILNVIAAAQQNGCKIIFFDNVYLYGPSPLANPITEEHEVNPPSAKGKVRKRVIDVLWEAHSSGKVELVVGRSPDFYGPGVKNSLLYVSAIENLLKSKPVQFIGNPDTKHNFIYVPDAARALVRLATDASSYGQTWHLPTNEATHTTRELLQMAADNVGIEMRMQVMPKWTLPFLQIFIPIIKEVREMTYQTESEYSFSSAKFMSKYSDFRITPYDEGIKQMLQSFQDTKGSQI